MTQDHPETPRTAAGRALAAWSDSDAYPLDEYGPWRSVTQAILAIEAEAAARQVSELRAAAEALPRVGRPVQRNEGWFELPDTVERSAVLALLAGDKAEAPR